jgi:hypothetical protein
MAVCVIIPVMESSVFSMKLLSVHWSSVDWRQINLREQSSRIAYRVCMYLISDPGIYYHVYKTHIVENTIILMNLVHILKPPIF